MNVLGLQVKMESNFGSSEIPKRFIVSVAQFGDKIIKRINDLKPDQIIYVN